MISSAFRFCLYQYQPTSVPLSLYLDDQLWCRLKMATAGALTSSFLCVTSWKVRPPLFTVYGTNNLAERQGLMSRKKHHILSVCALCDRADIQSAAVHQSKLIPGLNYSLLSCWHVFEDRQRRDELIIEDTVTLQFHLKKKKRYGCSI